MGIVVLAIGQCLFWLVFAAAMWTVRSLMLPPSSPQVEYNTRFAVALFALAVINGLVLAVIVFLRRRRGRSALVLAAMQMGNIVASLWASVSQDNIGWLVMGGIPAAVSLLLIFVLRRTETRSADTR